MSAAVVMRVTVCVIVRGCVVVAVFVAMAVPVICCVIGAVTRGIVMVVLVPAAAGMFCDMCVVTMILVRVFERMRMGMGMFVG